MYFYSYKVTKYGKAITHAMTQFFHIYNVTTRGYMLFFSSYSFFNAFSSSSKASSANFDIILLIVYSLDLLRRNKEEEWYSMAESISFSEDLPS